MIAEDEPRIASFVEKGLQAAGYVTTVVTSGVEVAERTRGRDVDLLILDLSLSAATVVEAGPLRLDLVRRTATVAGREVELTSREFLLLETLARHPGQVLSREQLLDRVWGMSHDPGSNVVDVYVGYLRRKLGADLIQTVRGVGYRMAVSVR